MQRADRPDYVVRSAVAGDNEFIVEMARFAAWLGPWGVDDPSEERPVPAADSEIVRATAPESLEATVVAVEGDRRLGAAWWHFHDPPLVDGVPEMIVAVAEDERGRGVGTALVDALAERAALA